MDSKVSFLGLSGLVQVVVVRMLVFQPIIDFVYSVASRGFQVLVYIVLFSVLFMAIASISWALVNYLQNRGKPKKEKSSMEILEEIQSDIDKIKDKLGIDK